MMPWGYVAFTILVTLAMVLSAWPLARSAPLATLTWLLTALVNESPTLAALGLLLSTGQTVFVDHRPISQVVPWFLLAGASLVAVGPLLLRRASWAVAALETAMVEALGNHWSQVVEPARASWRRRPPWFRIVAAPLPVFARRLRRRRGLRYGSHRRQRLDVYGTVDHPIAPDNARPVLIHLHGGGFHSGRKSFYARPLLHAFARHGWVCVSASYRLHPASYAEILGDAKRVIAWTRNHIADYGGDPDTIILAGSSAGAHLALTAALTANRRDLQPEFEDADTSVAAGIGLYGYYGPTDSDGPPSYPAAYAHPGAPPIMIVHGSHDTVCPPERARELADALRKTSGNPVVYAELRGAQHSFDLLHSRRFELVVDGVWKFATWVIRAPADITHDPTQPPV
jgi:acetyl esterase/lipase